MAESKDKDSSKEVEVKEMTSSEKKVSSEVGGSSELKGAVQTEKSIPEAEGEKSSVEDKKQKDAEESAKSEMEEPGKSESGGGGGASKSSEEQQGATTQENLKESKEVKTQMADQTVKPVQKKRFSFSLPRLRKKADEVNVSINQGLESKKLLVDSSPQEVVNRLDPAVKVITKTKAQELAETLEKQIKESQSDDFFEFRLRKKTVLVGLGFLVGLMWVIPVLRGIERVFLGGQSVFDAISNTREKTGEMNQEASQSGMLKIRIKNASGSPEAVEPLVELLKQSQYDQIEVVNDEESYQGIQVVVKPNEVDLKTALMRLLQDKYQVATAESELSEDSDFQAVILFGKTDE